jgi:hypothetical protein
MCVDASMGLVQSAVRCLVFLGDRFVHRSSEAANIMRAYLPDVLHDCSPISDQSILVCFVCFLYVQRAVTSCAAQWMEDATGCTPTKFAWENVKAASVERLAGIFCSPTFPFPCRETFACIPLLVASVSLFRLFVHAFVLVPPANPLPPLHARIVAVVERWVEAAISDFSNDEGLLLALRDFLSTWLALEGGYAAAAVRIRAAPIEYESLHRFSGISDYSCARHTALFEHANRAVLRGCLYVPLTIAVALAAVRARIDELARESA